MELLRTMTTLADFIDNEIKKRNLTAREFADLIGVSHTTIGRARDPRRPPEPSLDFLIKLAKATSTDIRTLVALIVPDATNIDPEAQLMAERIAKLSRRKREVVDAFIMGIMFQQTDEEDKPAALPTGNTTDDTR